MLQVQPLRPSPEVVRSILAVWSAQDTRNASKLQVLEARFIRDRARLARTCRDIDRYLRDHQGRTAP